MSWTRPLTDDFSAWYRCDGLAEATNPTVNAAVEHPGSDPIAIGDTSNGSTETRFQSYWNWGDPTAANRPKSFEITWGENGDGNISASTGFTFCAFVRGYNNEALENQSLDLYLLSGGGAQHPIFFKEQDGGMGYWSVWQDCYGPGIHTLHGNAQATPYGSNIGGMPGTPYGIHNVTPHGTEFIQNDETLSGNYDNPWDHIAVTISTAYVPVDPSNPLILDWSGGSEVNQGDPDSVEATKYVIYKNGNLVSTNYLLTDCGSWTINESVWYLNGGLHGAGHEPAFRHMADIGIWERALSPTEIMYIATDGILTSLQNSIAATTGGGGGGNALVDGSQVGQGAHDPCAGSWAAECGLGKRYDSTDGARVAETFQTNPGLRDGPGAGLITEDTLSCINLRSGWQTAAESQRLIDEIFDSFPTLMADSNNFLKDDGSNPTADEVSLYQKSVLQSLNGIAYRHALSLRLVSGYDLTWPEVVRTTMMKTEFDTTDVEKTKISKHGKVALQELYDSVSITTKYCGAPAYIQSTAIMHGAIGSQNVMFSALSNVADVTEVGNPAVIIDVEVKAPVDQRGIQSNLEWGASHNARILWVVDTSNNAGAFTNDDDWLFATLGTQSSYGHISLECPGWTDVSSGTSGERIYTIRIACNLVNGNCWVWGDWDGTGGYWADHSASHVSYIGTGLTALGTVGALTQQNRDLRMAFGLFEGIGTGGPFDIWRETEMPSNVIWNEASIARPKVASVGVTFVNAQDDTTLSFTDQGSNVYSYDDWLMLAGNDFKLLGEATYSYINSAQSLPEYQGDHNALMGGSGLAHFNVAAPNTSVAGWTWTNMDSGTTNLLADGDTGDDYSGISRIVDITSAGDGQVNIGLEVEGVTASYEVNLLDTGPVINHPSAGADIFIEIPGSSPTGWTDPEWNLITVTDVEDGDLTTSLTMYTSDNPGYVANVSQNQSIDIDTLNLTAWSGNPGNAPNQVIYEAVDSFGNTTTMARNIYVIDTTPPVLTLNQDPNYGAPQTFSGIEIWGTVDIQSAGSYTDPGYVSSDDSDTATGGGHAVSETYHYWDHGAGAWASAGSDPSVAVGNTDRTTWTAANGYAYAGLVNDEGMLWRITYEALDSWGNSTVAHRHIALTNDVTAPAFSVISLTNYPSVILSAAHNNSIWVQGNPFIDDNGNPITATDDDGTTVSVVTSITHTAPAYLGGAITTLVGADEDIDTSRAGIFKINFSATDAAGNVALLTRTIEVLDTAGPTITINGGNSLYSNGPVAASDFEYTLYDLSDGNALNQNINSVDVQLVGDGIGGAINTYTGNAQIAQAGSEIAATINAWMTAPNTGEVVVKYTARDLAGNVSNQISKTVQIGCCDLVESLVGGDNPVYPPEGLYYAARMDTFDANGTGMDDSVEMAGVLNGFWSYNRSTTQSIANDEYGPMLHGLIGTQPVGQLGVGPQSGSPAGDMDGDGTTEYVALCFILDPDNECNVVGFAVKTPDGYPVPDETVDYNMIIDSWPLDADWDGKDIWDSNYLNTLNPGVTPPYMLKGKNLDPDPAIADSLLKNIIAQNGDCCPPAQLIWPIAQGGQNLNYNPGAGNTVTCTDNDDCPQGWVCNNSGECVYGGQLVFNNSSDKDLKKNIMMVPNPTKSNYHLIGLYTVEYDWNPIAEQLFGLTGHVEEGFIAEQLEELYPAPDPDNPPTSKEDGHIWWHQHMTPEQKAVDPGVHNYYTFFNSEMLEAEIQAAVDGQND